MRRKIVQQGPTTLMVSLPIDWVRKFGLRKGEEVDLEEKGSEILVRTSKRKAKTQIEITMDLDDGLYIWRTLQSLYVAGYDEIKIYYSSKQILERIQDSVLSFIIGFEVVSYGEGYCILKQISTELNEEFETVFKRVFQTILQMSDVFTKFLECKNDLEMIRNLEKMTNRHVIYLKRILIKERSSAKTTPILYLMVDLFEKIANEYKYLLFSVKEIGKFTPVFAKKYNLIHKEIDETYDLFYSYSEEKLKKSISNRTPAEKLHSLNKENAILTYHMINILSLNRNVLFQIMALQRIEE